MTDSPIAAALDDWLIEQALQGTDLASVVDGLCARARDGGVGIRRAHVAWPTLHPLFDAETVTWTAESGAVPQQFPHELEEREAWLTSPLRHMIVEEVDLFRRRLAGPAALLDFPLLADLAAAGHTDYLAHRILFEVPRQAGDNRSGCIVTWTTDRPGGFSDEDVALLGRLRRGIALVCRTTILSRIASSIAETYLGRRAGGEVLAGVIRRGDGRTIRAVIWYSDLRGSTALAERLSPAAFLGVLNHYFECTAGAVVEAGGEVLDFIGDAVLAVFPIAEPAEAAAAVAAATAAADAAVARAGRIDVPGLAAPIELGVALASGEVMFGNIGIPARLAFSVIGPTVNAVARIEKATKLLGEPVLATAAIAGADPAGWRDVGRHALAGFEAPVTLYARVRAEP